MNATKSAHLLRGSISIAAVAAAVALVAGPTYAGRDAGQLLMQDKANREAAAQRRCAKEVAKVLEHRLRAETPSGVPSTDEARALEAKREEEIAACIERLKKAN